MRRNLKALEEVIERQGTDYSQYDQEAKMAVLKNVKIIQVLKVAIDTPILDEDGSIYGSASANLARIDSSINDGFYKIENV